MWLSRAARQLEEAAAKPGGGAGSSDCRGAAGTPPNTVQPRLPVLMTQASCRQTLAQVGAWMSGVQPQLCTAVARRLPLRLAAQLTSSSFHAPAGSAHPRLFVFGWRRHPGRHPSRHPLVPPG